MRNTNYKETPQGTSHIPKYAQHVPLADHILDRKDTAH